MSDLENIITNWWLWIELVVELVGPRAKGKCRDLVENYSRFQDSDSGASNEVWGPSQS